MRILRYFSIFFVLGYAAWYFYAGDKPYQSISGQTMGTYYNVKIRTRKEDNMLPQKIRQRLDELNREMSVFDSESEISRLNNAKAGEWIDLSPEMSKVMKDSAKIWRLSGGAFDPTVGRLVDLWGFGASVPKKAPSEAEIKEVLKYTGFDKLKFADGYSRVKKSNDNIYINLSAIAKGYGVDRIAKLLEDEGYTDFVVEIGGEVVARGSRSEEEKGWKIGVVKPAETPETAFVADLRNAAVSGILIQNERKRRLSQLLLQRRQKIFAYHFAPKRLSGRAQSGFGYRLRRQLHGRRRSGDRSHVHGRSEGAEICRRQQSGACHVRP